MTTKTTDAAAAPERPVPPRPAAAPGADVRGGPDWSGAWFVLPFAAFYALFLLWPSLAMLGYSFTDRSLAGGDVSWVGFANWAEAFSDPNVWQSLWVTVLFTLLSVPPLVLLGLAMAILADHVRRMGWFVRFAFFAPYVLPVAVMFLIWEWMYQPGFGVINQYLEGIGLSEVAWLGDERTVLIAIVIATVWWTVGFNFVLYLAALQGIPKETYEAAEIDGAGAWRKIWSVTLPQLKRITALVVVLQVVASLRIFDQAYLLGGVWGGPENASRTFIHYMYQSGFVGFRVGLASAMAWILFAVMLLASVFLFRVFTRDER